MTKQSSSSQTMLNYLRKGYTFYNLERYLEAIECYDEAIKLGPNKADFYNYKGTAFNKLKRYLEAIECYDKAIGCYGWYDEEIEQDYDEEIEQSDGKIAEFYNNKGTAFIELERYLEAIECFDKAIKLNPEHADCTLP